MFSVFIVYLIGQQSYLVVLLPVMALLVLSFVDDRRGLPSAMRFSAHLGAALIFVLNAKIFSLTDLSLAFLATIGLVWMTNLYNFMDGSDGLAGGMTLFGFGAYGVVSILNGDQAFGFAAFNFSIAAAALGFLFFNFHPAKIFLGDAGSVPLGFLAGAMGLQGWYLKLWPAWFPVLVFAPFIADATVTLIKRILRREKFWQAHREHYYQRLVQMGFGHRKTALMEYGLMAASGVLAILLLHVPSWAQIAALFVWSMVFIALMVFIDLRWTAHVTTAERPI